MSQNKKAPANAEAIFSQWSYPIKGLTFFIKIGQ